MVDLSALVLDIDGTLVCGGEPLSERNLVALLACRERGMMTYVATARPHHLVLREEEAGPAADFLSDRGAFYSGAMALDEPKDYWRLRSVGADMVEFAIRAIEDAREDVQIVLQNADGTHAFRLPVPDHVLPGWGIRREDVVEFETAREEGCLRMVIFHPEAGRGIMELRDVVEDAVEGCASVRPGHSGLWMEVLSSKASKEGAIQELLEERDISPERVAVFGNDSSDAGLFELCGVSVAMAEAPDELQEGATHLTLSCCEDGVAHGIEEILGMTH
jgi:hypothetical protein